MKLLSIFIKRGMSRELKEIQEKLKKFKGYADDAKKEIQSLMIVTEERGKSAVEKGLPSVREINLELSAMKDILENCISIYQEFEFREKIDAFRSIGIYNQLLTSPSTMGLPILFISLVPPQFEQDLAQVFFNLKYTPLTETQNISGESSNINIIPQPYYFVVTKGDFTELNSSLSSEQDIKDDLLALNNEIKNEFSTIRVIDLAKEWFPALNDRILSKYKFWTKNKQFIIVVFRIVKMNTSHPVVVINMHSSLSDDVYEPSDLDKLIMNLKNRISNLKIIIKHDPVITDITTELLKGLVNQYLSRGTHMTLYDLTFNDVFVSQGGLQDIVNTLGNIVNSSVSLGNN